MGFLFLRFDAGGMYASVAGEWNSDAKIACPSNVLTAKPCRIYFMMQTTFEQNTAGLGAGGLFVSAPEKIIVGCGVSHTELERSTTSRDARNQGSHVEECFKFRNNTVLVRSLVWEIQSHRCARSNTAESMGQTLEAVPTVCW